MPKTLLAICTANSTLIPPINQVLPTVVEVPHRLGNIKYQVKRLLNILVILNTNKASLWKLKILKNKEFNKSRYYNYYQNKTHKYRCKKLQKYIEMRHSWLPIIKGNVSKNKHVPTLSGMWALRDRCTSAVEIRNESQQMRQVDTNDITVRRRLHVPSEIPYIYLNTKH